MLGTRTAALPYQDWYCRPIGGGPGHSIALHLAAGPLHAPIQVWLLMSSLSQIAIYNSIYMHTPAPISQECIFVLNHKDIYLGEYWYQHSTVAGAGAGAGAGVCFCFCFCFCFCLYFAQLDLAQWPYLVTVETIAFCQTCPRLPGTWLSRHSGALESNFMTGSFENK